MKSVRVSGALRPPCRGGCTLAYHQFGVDSNLLSQSAEVHRTPAGSDQQFVHCLRKFKEPGVAAAAPAGS